MGYMRADYRKIWALRWESKRVKAAVMNPIISMAQLPKHRRGQLQHCLTLTTSFVIDYILGQKTENDWAGFKAKLESVLAAQTGLKKSMSSTRDYDKLN